MFELAGGAVVYSPDAALATVAEYAFNTVTVGPSDLRFRDAFQPDQVPRFAYRTYDCIPASPGRMFSDLDLFVIAGLNAGVDVPTFARLRSFADRAAAHLDIAHHRQPDFLQLSREELGNDPLTGSAGWHLNRAWQQGMATPGLRVARVYKLLHHKRPRLFPLLDNMTIEPIEEAARAADCTLWQLIWDELHGHSEQFQNLASAFDALATGVDDVSLSWLRLYDILVWMKVAR